jgi:hypothetical protein
LAPFFSRIDAGIASLAAAFAVFAAVLLLPAVLNDGDLYWHIAAGRWAVENMAVLRIDPFSFTFAGHPWQTQDWLAEIVMALAFIGAGWSGLLLLFAAAAAITTGLLVFHLSRWLSDPALWAVAGAALLCGAGAVLARPYMLALPFAEIWLAGLVAARAENRAPSFKLLLAMLLWANLHAGFLLGLALVIPFALEAVFAAEKRLETARHWLVFLGMALAVSLLTPYGIDGLVHAVRQAPVTPVPVRTYLPFAIAAAALVVLARRSSIPWWRVAALALLLGLAVMHSRDQAFFAVAAPLFLAAALAAALECEGKKPQLRVKAASLFVLLLAGATALRFLLPVVRADDGFTPAKALAQVPLPLSHAPVLNEAAYGGYLIFSEVRPFIDSRRGLYPRQFRDRYGAMMRPDKTLLAAALRHYRIRWTLLAAGSPAVQAMDAMAGWHRLYADPVAVVHVRNDAL